VLKWYAAKIHELLVKARIKNLICSKDERNTLVVPVISFEVANRALHLQAKLMRNQKLRGLMWLSHYQD